ncbi:hypothetical protein AAF712_014855, partial [Marasmius tenuissimus]
VSPSFNAFLRMLIASNWQYMHTVNRNENFRHREVILERRARYGQLLRIVEFEADISTDGTSEAYLVAIIRTLKTSRPSKLKE